MADDGGNSNAPQPTKQIRINDSAHPTDTPYWMRQQSVVSRRLMRCWHSRRLKFIRTQQIEMLSRHIIRLVSCGQLRIVHECRLSIADIPTTDTRYTHFPRRTRNSRKIVIKFVACVESCRASTWMAYRKYQTNKKIFGIWHLDGGQEAKCLREIVRHVTVSNRC